MSAVLARFDPVVPLRYHVHHTNNQQTRTAPALVCHPVNVYDQTIQNPPPGFNKWEIDLNDQIGKVGWGKMIGREPPKPCWVVDHLTFSLLYDRNIYH